MIQECAATAGDCVSHFEIAMVSGTAADWYPVRFTDPDGPFPEPEKPGPRPLIPRKKPGRHFEQLKETGCRPSQ